MKTDIVLIDTGVEIEHKEFKGKEIKGLAIGRSKGEYAISKDFIDNWGHGTSIYYILNQNIVDAEIFVLKLFDSDTNMEVDLEDMIYALEYIDSNIDCKIIHMSLGISYCEDILRFEKICYKLHEKGIILISAFDNLGTISYPAAFPYVIGIDICDKRLKNFDYMYVKNSPVNIRFMAKEQRLPFIHNEYRNMVGSSFMAPYITKLIIENYDKIKDDSGVHELLKINSHEIINIEKRDSDRKMFPIEKAILFPFNKEMHSVIANHDLCNFEIQDIFDVKYLGNVGKKVSDILGYGNEFSKRIKDISKIDWNEDFDTVILGHVKELTDLIGVDYIDFFIKNCSQHHKKLYCFDNVSQFLQKQNIEKNLENIFYPSVQKKFFINNTFGKMYCIGKPVLAVMGTSSKQGKYTLQLILRRELLKAGYAIGQLGTEPSAYLFGFQEMYSYGYGADNDLSGSQAIYFLNTLMRNIEKDNVDLIITGSQSQTVHYNTGNLRCYSLQNVEFLLGVDPDIIVVCVNCFDSIEYIRRTVRYIEEFQEGKVVALVLYPVKRDIRWSTLGNCTTKLLIEEVDAFKEIITKELKLPCFLLSHKEEMKQLVEVIMDSFS